MKEILLKPYLTEKSNQKINENKYTFVVARRAGKTEIGQEIEAIYKVKVEKVNVLNRKGEKITIRGRYSGQKKSFKLAVITLKKNQKIPGFENK